MWEVQAALEVFQTVLAFGSGVYFVGARFKQVETRKPNTTPFIWLLAAMLHVSTVELAILIVWTGWMPNLLPLATVLLQILALAIQIEQLDLCIAEDKEDKKGVWHAYLGSWIIMAVVDTLAIVRLALIARSLTFDVVYTGVAASLRCCLELTLLAIFFQATIEGYIQLGGDIKAGTTTAGNSGNSEETESSEPSVLRQSVGDEIRATGGLWPWLKKFHIFLPWIWPSSELRIQLCIFSSLALKLGETALGLIVPRCEARYIETLVQAFKDREPGPGLPALALYLAVLLLSSEYGLPSLRSLLWKEFEIYRRKLVQLSIYAHLMNHEVAFYNSNSSKDIEISVDDMGSTVCETIDLILLTTLPEIITLISSGITIFSLYGRHVALVQTFVIILNMIIILHSERVIMPIYDAEKTASQETQGRRLGALQGFLTIALHGQASYEIGAYATTLDTEIGLDQKGSVLLSIYRLCLGSVSNAGKFVTMVFVFMHGLRTGGTVAPVLAFPRYWDLLEKSLMCFVETQETIVKNLRTAAQLRRIMETKPQMEYGTEDLHFTDGSIKFKNVSFCYPGTTKTVLRNLSFDIEAKKTTAFVGPSGVGKSTILFLIARMFEPTEGSIEIDGQDIKMLKKGVLSKYVSVMTQTPHVFNATFKQNIRYSQPKADIQDVHDAAKKAGIHNTIMKRGKQYDDMLGESGGNLSGGQKQRIALSRTLIHNGGILLCDEPTSALDTETEAHVKKGIKTNKTTVMVAHRLSSTRDADKIIVLIEGEDGCGDIAEEGTHEELVAQNGTYAKLWNKHICADETEENEQATGEVPIGELFDEAS